MNTYKITKRDIDRKIIESIFTFEGYTDNEKTALDKVIAELRSQNIPYTMSQYVKEIRCNYDKKA